MNVLLLQSTAEMTEELSQYPFHAKQTTTNSSHIDWMQSTGHMNRAGVHERDEIQKDSSLTAMIRVFTWSEDFGLDSDDSKSRYE